MPQYTYGCELWGLHPRYASQRKLLLSTFYSHLRQLAGIHPSVPHVMLTDALGIQPVDHHWSVRAVKFWCKLWERPHPDFWLHVVTDNWCDFVQHGVSNVAAGLVDYFTSLQLPIHLPLHADHPPMHSASTVLDCLAQRTRATFASVEHDPRVCLHRPVLCTYVRYFQRPAQCGVRPLHMLPLAPNLSRTLFRFILGCHRLPVHVGRLATPVVPRSQRFCPHCGPPFVGDERHMIFECLAVQPLRLARPHLFKSHVTAVAQFVWQSNPFAVARFLLDALLLSAVPGVR